MSSWSIPSFRRHRGAVDGLGGLAHLIAPTVTLPPEHLPYGAGSGEGARRAGEVVQLRFRVHHPIGLQPSAPLLDPQRTGPDASPQIPQPHAVSYTKKTTRAT